MSERFRSQPRGPANPIVRGALLLILLASTGCSEELLDPGTGVLTSGQEPDAWSVEPQPTLARVETVDANGNFKTIAERSAPIREFSFGEGSTASFLVTGSDDAGKVLVRGRTMPLSPAGLAQLKLPVFVARADELARPPGNLTTEPGDHPPLALVGGRYVVIAHEAQLDGYDFGAWLPVDAPPPLGCPSPPCVVRSLAVVSNTLTLVVGDDWALSLDVSSGQNFTLDRPTGLGSWADVSGGATVTAPDGSSYVIGATRADPPTRSVVRIASDGKLSSLSLVAERHGAAAAWVPGRGLVVLGGSAQAAGAEILTDGADAFTSLPFAPDPTTGAAAIALANGNLIRAGGRDGAGAYAPSATYVLGCGTNCTPEPTGVDAELDHARGFLVATDAEPDAVLVVGDDASGQTMARLLGATRVDVPLREPRSGAVAFAAPSGHVAIVGGTHLDGTAATSLELFIR